MRAARIDLSARNVLPSASQLIVATLLAVVLSLTADALIVFIGTRMFPSTRGYPHFRFADYATLTIVGVVVACAAWPIVIRVSSCPRWLFIRLAAVVTIVLWIPDLYLLLRQQPVPAVALLMTMHLVVAIVTYNLLVRVAPPPPTVPDAVARLREGMPEESLRTARSEALEQTEAVTGRSIVRWAWLLEVLVGIEVALGIATLVVVPTGRSSGWLPSRGTTLYFAHAALGLPLALGALAYLAHVWGSSRINLLSAWSGLVGVTVAGVGGLLTVEHPLRLVGMALMLVGAVVAAFGFLLPALDNLSDEDTRTDG
jgi:hypothetical protein